MDSGGFLARRFLQSVLEVCRQNGVELAQLEYQSGLALAENDDGVVSAAEYSQLLDVAAELCADDFIGLHVGEAIKPGHYGVLGYACMSSDNLGEALQRALRYQKLVTDICSFSFQAQAGKIIQTFQFHFQNQPARQLAEENVAGAVSFARWISGNTKPPLAVHFQHCAPADVSEYQRLFNCDIAFEQKQTQVVFPADYLAVALPQADKKMAAMMEQYAEELLLKMAPSDHIVDKAAAILADLLQNGEPGLEKLAVAMNTNARSLQRQLQAETMTYQQLLERVRKQLALFYIAQPQLSLTDIAFLSGFSEQSSFQRAFKRWTGETPGRYRKQAGG